MLRLLIVAWTGITLIFLNKWMDHVSSRWIGGNRFRITSLRSWILSIRVLVAVWVRCSILTIIWRIVFLHLIYLFRHPTHVVIPLCIAQFRVKYIFDLLIADWRLRTSLLYTHDLKLRTGCILILLILSG